MCGRPRSSDMVESMPGILLSARYTWSSRNTIRLPSTCTTALSGSMRRPISLTTRPSTFTRPSLISSSALRREATPAAASTFCNRTPSSLPSSSSTPSLIRPVFFRWVERRLAFELSVIFEGINFREQGAKGRKVLEGGEPEPFDEQLGGAVQQSAGFGVLPDFFDQAARDQSADDAVDVDATDTGDAGPGDRLPVGDDGQSFQGRSGQPALLAARDETFDHRGEPVAGVEAPAAAHLAQLDPGTGTGVTLGQCGQFRPDPLGAVPDRRGQAGVGDGGIDHQQDSFQGSDQIVVGHHARCPGRVVRKVRGVRGVGEQLLGRQLGGQFLGRAHSYSSSTPAPAGPIPETGASPVQRTVSRPIGSLWWDEATASR